MLTSTATVADGGWQPSAAGPLSTGLRCWVCMTPGWHTGSVKIWRR